jgi:rhamnose utilization protein RhaD (predicted bifunctional aldolase and dehydrogenase)
MFSDGIAKIAKKTATLTKAQIGQLCPRKLVKIKTKPHLYYHL